VAFLESGFTWLPAHLWRMDKEWKNLRRLVPWVRRPPSDYVREHLRIGIQPLDAPPTAAQMLQIVDQLGSDDLLMYTSDFPHRHLFDAGEKLLDLVPQSMQNKIRSETARRLYRLDDGQGAQEHG
jgi:predicted TIM-barrel fold metal-dependent hydrolase